MRNNGSASMRTHKSLNARSSPNKLSSNSVRGFFVVLIIIAVALSALAVHLTTKLNNDAKKTNNNIIISTPEQQKLQKAASAASDNAQTHIVEQQQQQQQQQQAYPNGPKTDPKYANDRVYCMVPFIWNEEIYDIIMKTWGKRCNVIHFITDSEVVVDGKLQGDKIIHHSGDKAYKQNWEFPEGTFPSNVKFINMTRPWTGCNDKKSGEAKVCRHIWEKMWRSWVYVADNHLNEAEWFCKVDYDTFFFPENLQYYVRDQQGWDAYNEHHYFGLILSHRIGWPEMIAGAAACWSHKTLEGIADVYRNMPKGYTGIDRGRCEDRREASEEISTSFCLKEKLNVTAESALDPEMRQYVMVDPYHNQLTWNRTKQGDWWYWKGKPPNIGQEENCCAIHPMGIHKYKNRDQIESVDKQFYGDLSNKELTKLDARTRRYADKVRKALGIDN